MKAAALVCLLVASVTADAENKDKRSVVGAPITAGYAGSYPHGGLGLGGLGYGGLSHGLGYGGLSSGLGYGGLSHGLGYGGLAYSGLGGYGLGGLGYGGIPAYGGAHIGAVATPIAAHQHVTITKKFAVPIPKVNLYSVFASLCGSVGKDFVYHDCSRVPTEVKNF